MEIECLEFQITVHSAQDLENVRNFFQSKVYALISVGGEPRSQRKTPVDKEGGTNPSWHFVTGYTISTAAVEKEGVMVVMKLYCSRSTGDRYIGEVSVSLKDLFDGARESGGTATVKYPVKKGAADSQGELQFSYSFRNKVVVKKPSTVPAPAPAPTSTYSPARFGKYMLNLSDVAFDGVNAIDVLFFGEEMDV